MTPRREALLVTTACLVLFLTGAGDLPFYTRGEPREGLVVREMRASGAWLVPSRPDGELARKPPLFYWLAAGATTLLPDRPELAMRLPSALAGTGGVLATWAVARQLLGPAAALPSALLLATSFEWTRAAGSARVDMALTVGLTLLLAAWTAILVQPRRGLLAIATLGAATATLAKGPVALVLPGLVVTALVALRRDPSLLRRLGVVPVLGIAGAVAALWYVAAFAQHGWAFIDVVARENWQRFVDSDEADTGHSHGVFYLPLVGLVGLLPWTPLLPFMLARDRARLLATTFLATWIVVMLAFFSLADSKRSVYLLPLFPAVAMLVIAGTAAGSDDRWTRAARLLSALYAPALTLLALVAGALSLGIDVAALLRPLLKQRDAIGAEAVVGAMRDAGPLIALLALATLGAVPFVAGARKRGDWHRLVVVVAALWIAWTATFNALVHPQIAATRSLRAFMQRIDRVLPADATLYAFFPPDPGLRYYAPRPLAALSTSDPAASRHLLVWQDEWRRWRDAAGNVMPPVAVSDAREGRRGNLALVLLPPGKPVQAPETNPEESPAVPQLGPR
jgi:4-amino-4-deoxy-L-arabinose transferase-like glycosyltransferase